MGKTSPNETTRSIGKYMLIEELGEGYLGPVYRGFDQDLGRAVVVRILCESIKWDHALEEAFNRECKAVTALHHQNIAEVFDIGKEEQSYFVVTESLGCGTLRNLIARKSEVSVEAKLSIMIQVAEGLSYAHRQGVKHLGLGPGKIHLTTGGSVKIRDFSITSVLKNHIPHPPVRFGAPIYMCPEQIQQKKCDERSDIFSIGTIFYELLTGLHPFHNQDGNKALDNILLDVPFPTFEDFPDLPPGVWTILRKCLARDPVDRYQSMDALSESCRALLKSLAEDTGLLMSELYTSMPALRKAAAQPDASPATAKLLEQAESMLRSGKDADYVSLDRLMTNLLEHYPEIQAAAGNPASLEPLCPQLPPETIPVEEQKATTAFTAKTEPARASAPPAEKVTEEMPPIPEPVTEPAVQQCAEPEKPVIPAIAVPEQQPQERTATDAPAAAATTAPVTVAAQETPPAPSAGVLQKNEGPAEVTPPIESQIPAKEVEPPAPKGRSSSFYYRKMTRPSYRYATMALVLLLIAAAVYILFGTDAVASIGKSFSDKIRNTFSSNAESTGSDETAQSGGDLASKAALRRQSEILLKEARILADENHLDESRAVLNRILHADPSYGPAIAALAEMEGLSAPTNSSANQALQKEIRSISAMIDSDRLPAAKAEIDNLQQKYPQSSAITALRRQWNSRNALQLQELTRKEEEAQRAAHSQKDEQWARHLNELFARGRYSEAGAALTGWITEVPGSGKAQEYQARLQSIQQNLRTYTSAVAEGKYPEALAALSNAESLNPADSTLAELRRQAESKRSSARALLSIHRLGPKATVLFDSRPIGKDGELQDERVPIGSHIISIENGGGVVASRTHDFAEGKRIELVYDLHRQSLRTMTEADREPLAKRKAAEEVQHFALEHDHGTFRGSCNGTLALNYYDVAYTPAEGSHGFRIPFRQLKVRVSGKSVQFFYVSDNSRFNTFKFQDASALERFKKRWEELRALIQ